MTRYNNRIPYFKINKLVWTWKLCEEADAGIPVCDVGLSMAMAPPVKASPVKPSTPIARADKRDSLDKMVDDIERIADKFSRFKQWLDAPDPPKRPKPAETEKEVPPFDIQQIPDAMRKEHMPVSAKLMERWFSGELNYSITPKDQQNEINQNGELYPESMVDRTTIKLDWVLRHARAKSNTIIL